LEIGVRRYHVGRGRHGQLGAEVCHSLAARRAAGGAAAGYIIAWGAGAWEWDGLWAWSGGGFGSRPLLLWTGFGEGHGAVGGHVAVFDEPFDGELGGVLFGVFLAGEDGSQVAERGRAFADSDQAGEEV
jgi:hypothetical protein